MSEAPNPETVEAQQADPHDPEGIDAAAEAFAAKQGATPQPEDQAEPDPEPESEADTEAEEADPDDAEPTEQLAEVEYEGKTYSVPPELEKALLRQADYSRRMNEVGEKEKTYTQRLEALEGVEKAAEARAEALAELKAIDARIEAFSGIDWQQAKQADPAQAALAAVELMSLQQQRQLVAAKGEQALSAASEQRQKLVAEQRAEMAKVLDKAMPDWRGEGGTRLTQYAIKQGFKPEELGAITDPRLILELEKARKFDALQASKSAIKAKAQAAPNVVKPGATTARKPDARAEAVKTLRKTGSIDDAAAAFLARG